MVSTPHVAYADDAEAKAKVQSPDKIKDVEISEKPEERRGAIAHAVYSKVVSGGVRSFYLPYMNVASGSPVLVGITTGTAKYSQLAIGDQGGQGDNKVGYFSSSPIGSSKASNALARQDENFMQTFYKANDGYWYAEKEGKNLKAYYPVSVPSHNLSTGSEWEQKDFKTADELKKALNETMYVFVPVADIKTKGDNFDKSNSYAVHSNLTKKQEKKQSQADRKKSQQDKKKATTDQFASQYPNVGDRPSTNTLLAYIMYTKGGSGDDAIKDIDLSYGEIKYYPAPSSNVLVNDEAYKSNEAVRKYAGNGETKGAYIPNSINMAGSPQPEGKTLANMLKVYGGWGFITVSSTATDTNSTTSNDLGSILGDIWNNNNGWFGVIGNVILTILAPALWIVAMVFDVFNSVANAFLGFVTGMGNIFGDPIGMIFYKAKGESGSDNWLLNLAINIKDYFFTNEFISGLADLLNTYRNWIFFVWLLIGLLSLIYRMTFRKGKYGQAITKWFFRISAPVVMIILAGIVTGSATANGAGYNQQKEASDKEIDMLKYAVAFNLDLREAYNFAGKDGAPKYQELIDKDDIDISSWNMSSKQIKALNQRIEAKLGSELSTDLSQHNTQGATFDVNTYLNGIAQASKLANVHRTGNSVASNDLPAEFVKNGFMHYRIEGENKEKTKFTIYGAPMLKISGGSQQSADFVPVGYIFDGYPYIFTQNDASIKRQEDENESASDENKSTEFAYLSGTSDTKAKNYKKQFYIGFYGVYWEATPVTLSQPWTYLYGANTNNNAITEHPSTYMYGAGKSTQVANLRKQQGSKLEDDDKAPETVTAPQESEDGTGYKSEGRQHYFYWKYINAYNLALINKYMGTKSDMDVSDLQLSNQSVVFLLQSQLKETELRYYASNLNHSDSGKGKSSSKTPFIYSRFITPQKSDDIASVKISGFFITCAYTMILITYVKTLATMSITDYIVGRWKAMFAGIKGSWSSAVYYSVLTWFWGLIVTFIPATFQLGISIITTTAKTLNDSPLGMAGSFGVGFGVLCMAWVLTYPFVQVADKKISLIVGLIYMFDVIRLIIKGWLFGRYGLDSIIYQNAGGFGVGDLVGFASGGLLGAKQDLQQRLGGIKNSFSGTDNGVGDSPTTDEDGGTDPNSPNPSEGGNPNEPDGLPVGEDVRKELTEEEKQRNPFRNNEGADGSKGGSKVEPKGDSKELPKGLPKGKDLPKGKGLPIPNTPKGKLGKIASIAGKGAGFYYQVAKIGATATMSVIGMNGLANKTNGTLSSLERGVRSPQNPIRKVASQGVSKFRNFVDKRKENKPNPLKTNGKIPTAGEKPILPRRETKVKPTIVDQEQPIQKTVIRDNSSGDVPTLTRQNGTKPIKKPIRFPKKKRK